MKTHSYGEFVFDFAWAQAYERVGRRYYPKLTLAVPFTPATGPRLLVRPDLDRAALADRLLAELERHAQSQGVSSVHALFLDETRARRLRAARLAAAARLPVPLAQPRLRRLRGLPGEFHRGEAQEGAPRAPPRRGGRACDFETRAGAQLDEPLLDRVYELHRDTFLRHGHEPYLTRAFFSEIAAHAAANR